MSPCLQFAFSGDLVWFQWLEGVASVVPTLPLYYYHIAIMTGVNIRMDQLLEAIHGRIPSFRGLKYSGAVLFPVGLVPLPRRRCFFV